MMVKRSTTPSINVNNPSFAKKKKKVVVYVSSSDSNSSDSESSNRERNNTDNSYIGNSDSANNDSSKRVQKCAKQCNNCNTIAERADVTFVKEFQWDYKTSPFKTV